MGGAGPQRHILPTCDLGAAARCWSDAIGLPIGELSPEEFATCTQRDDRPRRSAHRSAEGHAPSRVHLDIETDDIDAEVERLEAIGAKRVQYVHTWCVMEAPIGQCFCVVWMKYPERGAAPNAW